MRLDPAPPAQYSFFAQLGGLFAKHKLEWVRTPLASYSEIVFPIALFVFCAVLRILMPQRTSDWTLDSFKQASYPVGRVSNITKEWQHYNFTEKQRFQDDIQAFYKFTNYTNTRKVNSKTKLVEDLYVPEYDFIGPYFYYPLACYSKRGREFSYPVIGYVQNDNEVERALLAQYQMVFKSQTEAAEMIN